MQNVKDEVALTIQQWFIVHLGKSIIDSLFGLVEIKVDDLLLRVRGAEIS